MASPMSADRLVEVLRAEGVTVREYRSWRTHNRNHRGAWGPINGVMIHHTVTSGTDSSVRLCYEGYSTLPGPLCHGVIAKDGTVYLVGNGRANHAGSGDDDVLDAVVAERDLPADNEANTDGNARFYGFECVNMGDGEDPWPDAQLEAIERAAAAICRHYGWSAASVIGHREWQPGKVDPRGFGMDWMRRRIDDRLAAPPSNQNHQEDDMAISDDDADKVARHTLKRDGILDHPVRWRKPGSTNEHIQLETAIHFIGDTALDAAEGVAALREQVERLAVGGVDEDALVDRIVDKLAARLQN